MSYLQLFEIGKKKELETNSRIVRCGEIKFIFLGSSFSHPLLLCPSTSPHTVFQMIFWETHTSQTSSLPCLKSAAICSVSAPSLRPWIYSYIPSSVPAHTSCSINTCWMSEQTSAYNKLTFFDFFKECGEEGGGGGRNVTSTEGQRSIVITSCWRYLNTSPAISCHFMPFHGHVPLANRFTS